MDQKIARLRTAYASIRYHAKHFCISFSSRSTAIAVLCLSKSVGGVNGNCHSNLVSVETLDNVESNVQIFSLS